jgi:hypothetical protein
MTLDEMIIDFCKRAETDYTPEHVKEMMANNYYIANKDGFIVFNTLLDECHCFFCYVVPGAKDSFRSFVTAVEVFAKANGCKKTKFITRRYKGFARLMKDYTPCAVMFEKGLI